MKAIRLLGFFVSVALVFCALSSSARADQWDKKTVMTFSSPVQVPGAVLQPGTYVFKLTEDSPDRNIVMVFDQDEQHLITTILAIPDYSTSAPYNTQVRFEERPGNEPQAISEWFYPGDNYGVKFYYRGSEGSAMPEQASYTQPAASTESENYQSEPATVATPEASNLAAQTDNAAAQDNTVAQNDQSAQPVSSAAQTDQNSSMAQTTPATTSNSATTDTSGDSTALPKTASSAPLIGLVGLFFLAGGVVLRSKARASAS